MGRRRIAFVPNPLDSTLKSSIGLLSFNLASRLKRDFEVLIYTGKNESTPSSEQRDGVTIRRLPVKADRLARRFLEKLKPLYSLKRPFFSSALYYPSFSIALSIAIREDGCDIVHLNNFTQFISPIRRLNPHSRITLHMHSEWLTQLSRPLIEKRIDRADLILNCSDYITGKTIRAFPGLSRKCRTLYNGVDLDVFSKKPAEDAGRCGKNIIYVGRLSPEKGVHVLLEAFEKVLARVPGATLTIIGQERIAPKEFLVDLSDDPLLKTLEVFYPGGYLEKLKKRFTSVLPSVRFTGQLSPAEIADHYRSADVCVSPSLYESFGMPVAEAMACGIPVVATRVGGVPEIIEDGASGLLVDSLDTRNMAEAIVALLLDKGLARRLGGAGAVRAREKFNWDVVAAELGGIYANA